VIIYQRGAVVSYGCVESKSELIEVDGQPVFHELPEIERSTQLELFDLSGFDLRYVIRRQPYRKRRQPKPDAVQLELSWH
jgi:hypothetical protein